MKLIKRRHMRFLPLLLALLMVFTSVPVSALAAPEETEAAEEVYVNDEEAEEAAAVVPESVDEEDLIAPESEEEEPVIQAAEEEPTLQAEEDEAPLALTQAQLNGAAMTVSRLEGVTSVSLSGEDHGVQNSYLAEYTGDYTETASFVLSFNDTMNRFNLLNGNGARAGFVMSGMGRFNLSNLVSVTDVFSISGYTKREGCDYYLLFSADRMTNTFDGKIAILICLPHLEEVPAPEILTQPVAETTCEKNEEVTLSVVADETLGQNLSYQWYSNRGNNSILNMYPISGATSSTYTVPTSYASTTKYHCVVTNSLENGRTCSVTSDTAVVTTRLTTVNEPTVEIYDGCEDDCYEFGSPDAFQISAQATDYIAFDNITLRLYCNEEDITEGGEVVWEFPAGPMGSVDAPVNFDTEVVCDGATVPGEPAGTYYYYATVSMDYNGVTYSAVSETWPVTYLPYTGLIGDNLEGSGTEENPFLIQTLADLEYLQSMVNRASATPEEAVPGATGYNFEGVYFRMEADIELPEDWTPIGSTKLNQPNPRNGMNINPFSGHFDGGGHTITVAEDGLPLFGYVRKATISNLNIYGTQIAGDGLVDEYTVDYGPDGQYGTGVPFTANIDHITILSGSRILESGLIGGYASGQNIVNITNCTVQEDVIIGYELDEDMDPIGSIAGSFNGTISNCVSYATVNGYDWVGGIAGCKGQSMGPFSVTNCEFYGTVTAEGEYAGGIVGCGYISISAPNTPCVDIENCRVNATVTGANYVGGIFGGEGGVVQTWAGESNEGTIRNNEFRGTVAVTEEDGIVGGVIGIMFSLNRHNIIENNYYAADCGAELGIGRVMIVDTDAMGETPAWNEDHTVLYINTSVDGLKTDDDACREIVGGTYPLIQRTDSNRSDDPLGADAARLCHSTREFPFSDPTENEEFNTAIMWGVDLGITTGWAEDNTFRPWNKCNRAAIVTFLWRMAGEPQPQGEFTFSDPTGNADFDTAITWAVEQGITTGWTSDNTFRPWGYCNRAAAITFLWRLAGKPEPQGEFAFSDPTGNAEFDKAITWAVEQGITTGWASDNTFRPWNTCNRASIMTFLYRYSQLDQG